MLDMTKRKKVWIAAAALVLLLSGCGAVQKDNGTGGAVSPSPEPPVVEQQSMELTIYAVENESMELTERTEKVFYSNDHELLGAAIASLQADPGNGSASLWKPIPIHSTQLKDGIVTIDIALPDEARVGAPGEMQLLESLKKTLFQLDFVDGIEILVDGNETESLMGHVGLDYPMTRE
ncbi:GerMN domain-containing protein [Paenibacillus sp. IITD108]